MSEHQHRLRRERRDSTDRFIAALQEGLAKLDTLSTELNRGRELDGEIRDALPAGPLGDTIREWLDGHDRVADELQETSETLLEVLRNGAEQAAETELYLHEIDPQGDDPRGER